MSEHETLLLEHILTQISCLDKKVSELAVKVEHRVTKLEVRTALIALGISALVSLAAALSR